MNGFDWGWLIVAVLILCTNAIAYILGDEHGREQERPRAWGDGWRVAMEVRCGDCDDDGVEVGEYRLDDFDDD